MKQSDIKVGAVYRNRGARNSLRKVTGIGVEFRPEHRFSPIPPDADAKGVEFQMVYVGKTVSESRRMWLRSGEPWSDPFRLWLDSFAAWAGSEVEI